MQFGKQPPVRFNLVKHEVFAFFGKLFFLITANQSAVRLTVFGLH
ncbi:hypothetical protein GAGA_0528 [Paraglaciecola agarilytica NO2]|uniref:Uncharacterized protein n=1 Tax=Paraglaciecola agarilytica NO2 TaxID=1125747 RepID=A0ABQ0I247_9ALTE|nr:hypothetical protein GAGA_0528 [Paraglaciecola agarilytica NO2]